MAVDEALVAHCGRAFGDNENINIYKSMVFDYVIEILVSVVVLCFAISFHFLDLLVI